ncbi:TetR/AcrR family transcriptional regulator [Gryllotalpicola protaetiae]|uniref:TetR/AcrR family transcriptional regulator n=1 Tax=Gryllotalpicola protaetiae TaxID=2419771 RepID=A0A387BPJ8_9MICO|nr:TetR/AcrR family transcriptional regulator [Gryllotalpicola protaetiae]AYG03974.1 TetR/AcrR family transcriptional regulator [Gryllotalpicola protaetiae]
MSTAEQPPGAALRSREHTREKLIDAAFEVFAEVGLNAASVEQITERAGFTRGAFYSNFDSKVELFFAIADDKYTRASEGLQSGVDAILAEALPAGHPITADALETIVTRVLGLTVVDSKLALFESEFEALALRDRDIATRYAGHLREVVAGLAGLLEGALARIGVRFLLPAEQATRLLITAYTAAMKTHLLSGGGDQPSVADLADVAALALVLTERMPER